MHEDFGANAGREPGTDDRAFRIDVLLDGVSETACVALMQGMADLAVENGLATPAGGDVRAVIAVHGPAGHPDLGDALRVVVPKAIPRSRTSVSARPTTTKPALRAGYSECRSHRGALTASETDHLAHLADRSAQAEQHRWIASP